MVIQPEENAAVQPPKYGTCAPVDELDNTSHQVETDEERRLLEYPEEGCERCPVWRVRVDVGECCK